MKNYEIIDNNETVQIPVFAFSKKGVELKVEEPVKEIEKIDPLQAIADEILNTVNASDSDADKEN